MHAELIGEIRGQHKKVLARAAESERKLASSTRGIEEQAARGARTQKRLERMLRELSRRQNEMRLMLLQANGARRSRMRDGARIIPTAAGLGLPATTPERPAPFARAARIPTSVSTTNFYYSLPISPMTHTCIDTRSATRAVSSSHADGRLVLGIAGCWSGSRWLLDGTRIQRRRATWC